MRTVEKEKVKEQIDKADQESSIADDKKSLKID